MPINIENEKKGDQLNSKILRFLFVAHFFITIPIFVGSFFIVKGSFTWNDHIERGNIVFWWILLPFIYIIYTDIVRGVLYYIDSGKYKSFIFKRFK